MFDTLYIAFLQTSMNVRQIQEVAIKMLNAITLLAVSVVTAIMATLAMNSTVLVCQSVMLHSPMHCSFLLGISAN